MCGDFTPFMSKSFQIWDPFYPLLFPKDSKDLIILDIGLWEVGGKKMFKLRIQMKKKTLQNLCSFLCGFKPFLSKNVQIWDHFFSLFSPKDFKYLKSLDIWLREVGTKRLLKGERKCGGQTHKHTNKHTEILTSRKNWLILWERKNCQIWSYGDVKCGLGKWMNLA